MRELSFLRINYIFDRVILTKSGLIAVQSYNNGYGTHQNLVKYNHNPIRKRNYL